MADILLIEPNYKNKYPPLGLMKIAYFHKYFHNDYVRFAKGKLPAGYENKKWDRVYVTTLFTFEWEKTKAAIDYAYTIVKDPSQVYTGGILATLMPDLILKNYPNIVLNTGLLNRIGTLKLAHEECIDRLPPDYSILADIKEEYEYPWHDGYFLYMTRGCGMKCQFCAVQTLEPDYVPFISIKEQVKAISLVCGEKKDLLLMDNNVLRSNQFDKIIDEIIEMGFAKGAKYLNPITKAKSLRFVDFNQGLDAKLMTEHKAQRLGEIALRPARIAFDHIEDVDYYTNALTLCAKNGITYLSNYLLYNGEDFTGKGSQYKADTPADLFNRMQISMNLCDKLNEKYAESNKRIHIFSFPMKYIPLNDLDRTYIGTNWNAKYLRAIQRMLIPTQGKGVSSRSFFEADFGKTESEFIENLAMPEDLLSLRGYFVSKKDELENERKKRYLIWKDNHKRINEWRRLYRILGETKEEFLNLIKNNDFSIVNFNRCNCELHKKLFIHYMSKLSFLKNLNMMEPNDITFVFQYIKIEFPIFYNDIMKYCFEVNVPVSALYSLYKLEGVNLIKDLLKTFSSDKNQKSYVFQTIYKLQKKEGKVFFDTRCLDYLRLYRKADVLSDIEMSTSIEDAQNIKIKNINVLLLKNFNKFETECIKQMKDEIGNQAGKKAVEKILSRIKDYIYNLEG